MAPSGVWLYFSKPGKDNTTRCSKCTMVMKFCNSTSSLKKHLLSCHNITIESVRPKASVTGSKSSSLSSSLLQEESVDDVTSSSDNENQVLGMGPCPPKIPKVAASQKAGPLDRCLDKMSSLGDGGRRNATINNALLYMIAVDKQTLSMTERKGFRFFVKTICPLYRLPCAATVTKMMEEKYNSLKMNMRSILAEQKDLTITTDLWSETMTMRSYLGLTAHYLAGSEMKSVVIGAEPVPERKTIPILSEKIRGICDAWGITREKVSTAVTDNGLNISGACKAAFGEEKHLGCFAHKINLVASTALGLTNRSGDEDEPLPLPPDGQESGDEGSEDEGEPSVEIRSDPSEAITPQVVIRKIKKIVTFFRTSERASEELKNLQRQARPEGGAGDSQCLKLIQQVCTRWNSTFYMIERFLKLLEHVERVLSKVARERTTKSKPPPMLTTVEEDIAREICDLLKPLAELTLEISSEKTVTISKVIPLVNCVKKSLSEFLPTSGAGYNLQSALVFELGKRVGQVQKDKTYAIATILDPRFKRMHFDDKIAAANAVSEIVREIKRNASAPDPAPNSTVEQRPAAAAAASSLWAHHDELLATQEAVVNTTATDDVTAEMSQYLKRPVVPRDRNPIAEWNNHLKNIFPNIYPIAIKYLSKLATSVPSERLFSQEGQIITKLRNRLSGKHANQLLFLSSVGEELWMS